MDGLNPSRIAIKLDYKGQIIKWMYKQFIGIQYPFINKQNFNLNYVGMKFEEMKQNIKESFENLNIPFYFKYIDF